MTFSEAHRAIKRGQISSLEEAVPSAISANETNKFGWTLLMLTAIEGNIKIGAMFIERGANVAALNAFGQSALSLAAHKGHLPFVKLLKANGASSDVYPHEHSLEEWLKISSGLPQTKIEAILKVIRSPL